MNPQPIQSSPLPPVSDGASRPRGAVASSPAAAARLPPETAAREADNAASLGKAQAEELAAAANRRLAEKGNELTVEFDDASGRAIFRLVDLQTGALVRQIPSKEMLAIARALSDDDPAGALLRTDA